MGIDVLQGGSGTDRLTAGTGSDSLDGGTGNDILEDIDPLAFGNTTYVFARGYGQDTVTERGGVDQISLGTNISTSQVTLTRTGNDLVLSINGTTDKITVLGYYTTGVSYDARIESIRFSNGTVWDQAAIASRVVGGGGAATALSVATSGSASDEDAGASGPVSELVPLEGEDGSAEATLADAPVPSSPDLDTQPEPASPWAEVDEWVAVESLGFDVDAGLMQPAPWEVSDLGPLCGVTTSVLTASRRWVGTEGRHHGLTSLQLQ
jgi:hypothetical protein